MAVGRVPELFQNVPPTSGARGSSRRESHVTRRIATNTRMPVLHAYFRPPTCRPRPLRRAGRKLQRPPRWRSRLNPPPVNPTSSCRPPLVRTRRMRSPAVLRVVWPLGRRGESPLAMPVALGRLLATKADHDAVVVSNRASPASTTGSHLHVQNTLRRHCLRSQSQCVAPSAM